MPIQFSQLPIGKLNQDGSVEGASKPQEAPNIGIPTEEFHKQVIAIANNKVPLETANKAIDMHKEITDKATAKTMARAVYDILQPGKNDGGKLQKLADKSEKVVKPK